jgi:hypothetical protein
LSEEAGEALQERIDDSFRFEESDFFKPLIDRFSNAKLSPPSDIASVFPGAHCYALRARMGGNRFYRSSRAQDLNLRRIFGSSCQATNTTLAQCPINSQENLKRMRNCSSKASPNRPFFPDPFAFSEKVRSKRINFDEGSDMVIDPCHRKSIRNISQSLKIGCQV